MASMLGRQVRLPRGHTVPLLIGAVFLADALIIGIYVLNELAGAPNGGLNEVVRLDREGRLPTWWSSVQWFAIAIALGVFAASAPAGRRSWLLWLLPLVAVAMSLDEVVTVHEWLGEQSDEIVLGVDRQESLLPETGAWALWMGLPFIILAGLYLYAVRGFFRPYRRALVKIAGGLTLMLIGAVGVELLSNFGPSEGLGYAFMVVLEEGFEIIGASIILWGSCEVAVGAASGRRAVGPVERP